MTANRSGLAAVFLDCGDTLIDERNEIKQPGTELVLSGELIPGARAMLDALAAREYPLVLVADGLRQSFVNLLGQHQLWNRFEAHIISDDIGALKPDPRMFDAALAALGLDRADAHRCVMVGNNLSRDIAGANAVGITSVFLAWSSLRTRRPATPGEHPRFTISSPEDLPALLDRLESLQRARAPALFS